MLKAVSMFDDWRKNQRPMGESEGDLLPTDVPESTSSNIAERFNSSAHSSRGSGIPGVKKRGLSSRSWIKIDQDGNSKVLELDKARIMRHCSLPSRDLRLLDPLFIYPSTILGREKAIVVNLEQIRCIITAEEVILMNSLDRNVVQYNSELSKRLQAKKDQADDLPFEFRALELALELTCMSLDVKGNVQNHLIQFELLLTAATFLATLFATVTGVFGMNFAASIFDYPSAFTWVLVITGAGCGLLYCSFLLYFKHKKIFPL
ncbi:hypothetical protein V6N13_029528 [Hibiscus sabdariffa]